MRYKGFTLIEILVVLSILSLLASMLVANVRISFAKARDTQRVDDLGKVVLALELFHADYGRYPCAAFNDPCGAFCSDGSCDEYTCTIANPYISSLNSARSNYGVKNSTSPEHKNWLGLGYALERYGVTLGDDPRQEDIQHVNIPQDPHLSSHPWGEDMYLYYYQSDCTDYDLVARFETDHPLSCTYQKYTNHIIPPSSVGSCTDNNVICDCGLPYEDVTSPDTDNAVYQAHISGS